MRSIRPGHGLEPKHLPSVLGRRAARDVARGTPLTRDPKLVYQNVQETGGAERDRTADPLLAKQVLSQLSYGPLTLVLGPDIGGSG